MARTREKMKGRASHANFIGIPRAVADSAAYISLPVHARALYADLRRQFNGHNNGDICAAGGVLEKYGWAHSTISKHLKLLIDHLLIVKTRQGGIGAMSRTPCLYGFTDEQIIANSTKGISGAMASHAYRDFKPELPAKSKRNKSKVHAVNAKVHEVNF